MIIEHELPRLEIEEASENYARTVAEPLSRGFGTTIGNALRRVLLGSLPGAAIVTARIDQVEHGFSTLPHIKEDTTEFLLNVRGIRLRALSDRPGKLFLDASGTRSVTAADLEVPSDYEIVNKDLHLASLGDPKARLTATFDVEQGRGFVPAGTTNGKPIGVILVDAIFTPVRKVNYSVQPTRVGQESDYDRLILEVWTDGSISGTDAISQAAVILQNELTLFVRLGAPLPVVEPHSGEAVGLSPERYKTSIEELNLSVRAYNCLKRSGLMTVGQVLEKSEEELLDLRNFGEKSYVELMERLHELGFVDETDSRMRRLHHYTGGDSFPEDVALAADGDENMDETAEAVASDDTDEEISSLGTALLEALREAGQDPESIE